MSEKALIAMSGGVDSSVAAYFMKQAGYDCIGVTMKLFHNEDAGVSRAKSCCSLDDVEDARSVAHRLGIPYYVFNFTADFREQVMQRFVCAYENGATPNPCIDCNRYLKFDRLYHRARLLGCDCVVTGHYARIRRENGRFLLQKALDPSKDQSYVLYALTQDELAHTQLPLGGLSKAETRRMTYAAGDFVDRDGKRLGTHHGIIGYTVGQRRGLGIAAGRPLYVTAIQPETNRVVLGGNADLFRRELDVRALNWIAFDRPPARLRAKVKVRYRQTEQPATITVTGEDRVRVCFDAPQRAITAGQAAVIYDGNTVLGGGTIDKA